MQVSKLKTAMRGMMGLGLVAMLAATAGCNGNTRTQNAGPCPVAGAIYEASRLVEIDGAELHANLGFTGSIEGVKGYCRYVEVDPIDSNIEITFALGKGPKAVGNKKTYYYFVAVTALNSTVLTKEVYPLEVDFGDNKVVTKTVTLDGIIIPRSAQNVSGRNFDIVVGFELTPEQLAYNRSGKRFLMDVQKPPPK